MARRWRLSLLLVAADMPVYLGQAFDIPKGFAELSFGNVNMQIVNYLRSYIDTSFGWDESIRLGEIILPLYQTEIAEGNFPPFEFHEAKRTGITPTETAKMVRSLSDETGIKYLWIWNYLASLEMLAKGGVIDFKHYDPDLAELRTITEPHFVSDTLDAITKNLPAALRAAPEAVEKFQNRAIAIGAIGLGVYVLFTANKLIKKKK